MANETKQDGGPAFPKLTGLDPSWYDDDARRNGDQPNYFNADTEGGMSLRDYFAAKAPEAAEEWLKAQAEIDRSRNPHGDSYKPTRRSWTELRASWRYEWADAMLKARAQ